MPTREQPSISFAVFGMLFFMTTTASAVQSETLECLPEQKFACSPNGCKNVPAKVHALVDLDAETYSRCDAKGCDKYEASMAIGGIYLNVEVPGKSVIAKVEIPTLRYFETVSSGLVVATSFGKCSRR